MSPKKSRMVMIILSVIGLLFMLLASGGDNFNMTLMVIGFCIVMTGLIIELIYWRCPSCSRHLPKAHLDITYCPYCGEDLD